MTKLTTKIIESYNFEQTTSKPDWDDVQVTYELPNGLELSVLSVCFNEVKEQDSLEGLHGYICINTKEELDELINLSFEEIIARVVLENKEDFNKEEYI